MPSSEFFVKATISDFRKFLASYDVFGDDVFGDNVVNTSSIEFEVFDPHYEVSTVFNSPCAISNFNKLNNDFSDKSIVTKKRGMPRTFSAGMDSVWFWRSVRPKKSMFYIKTLDF